ncbi:MAG TPA: (2Fe-2S) ferredoxin domain-containing protein [Pirellulales bacterium]|jgi:(2Fe-2S) ferredoxin
MPPYTHHIFICCNTRKPGHDRGCCNPDDDEALRGAFQAALKKRGVPGLVRANRAGCLDQCEYGPTVVIYPQEIWYGRVSCQDAARIVDETIIGGRIIDELVIPNACLNTKGKVPWPAS